MLLIYIVIYEYVKHKTHLFRFTQKMLFKENVVNETYFDNFSIMIIIIV